MKQVLSSIRFGLFCSVLVFLLSFANQSHALLDSVSHFRHYLIAAIAFFSLLLFIISNSRIERIAIGLMSMLIGLYAVSWINPWSERISQGTEHDKTLDVIQFNMLFKNKSLESFFSYLKDQPSDVLLLQEVSKKNRQQLENIKTIYPYQAYCEFAGVGGVAIMSRYSIEQTHCVKGLGLVQADINFDGDQIRLASLHLYWPYPHQQKRQITELQLIWQKTDIPSILAGDFNATPWSETARQIERISNTEILKKVIWSFAYSFSKQSLTVYLPIDLTMKSKHWSLVSRKGIEKFGSDHTAIRTLLSLKPAEK